MAVDQLETEMLIAESAPNLIVNKSGGANPNAFETKNQNDWNIWE